LEEIVKTYRRIEITAFHRRVAITSGEFKLDLTGEQSGPAADEVRLRDADTGKSIDLESVDGQMMLAEAVRLLQQKLTTQKPEVYPCQRVALTRWQRFRKSRFYKKLGALGRFISRLQTRRFTRKEK
jgi:hypothetical protein